MLVLLLRVILAGEFLFTTLYCARDILKTKLPLMTGRERYVKNALIGFVTDFFDTLGIGCFAPTMFAWKVFGGLPKDEKGNDRDDLVPGTLNVGHALPVIAEALLFLGFA